MFKIVAGLMLLASACGAQMLPPNPAEMAVAHPAYVIRHLHKASGDDPQLTAEGAALARELAALLADKGIKGVFATPTRRAQETAAPLAALAKVPVTTYEPGDGAGLLKAVAAAGGPVLIVGHSNTVPDIVAALGGDRPAPIADDQYGTLYLIQPGQAEVRQLRLGAR